MSSPLVLLTGASGLIGSHIVHQVLDARIPLRLTARTPKADTLRRLYGTSVEVHVIDDLENGDYTECLQGVHTLVHTAMPLPFGGELDYSKILDGAIRGTRNILSQAVKAGVKKVIVTMSIACMVNLADPTYLFTDYTLTENDWNAMSREDALKGSNDIIVPYAAAKAMAEQEVWKFADMYPEVEFITLHPSYVYGPLAPGFEVSKGNLPGLSSVRQFYEAVLPPEGNQKKLAPVQIDALAFTVDVRDAARAHVLAIKGPVKAPRNGARKRFLINGSNFTWKMAVDHLNAVRPELKGRLADSSEVSPFRVANVDVTRAAECLGMTRYVDWKKTVEDTLGSLLQLEAKWYPEKTKSAKPAHRRSSSAKDWMWLLLPPAVGAASYMLAKKQSLLIQ